MQGEEFVNTVQPMTAVFSFPRVYVGVPSDQYALLGNEFRIPQRVWHILKECERDPKAQYFIKAGNLTLPGSLRRFMRDLPFDELAVDNIASRFYYSFGDVRRQLGEDDANFSPPIGSNHRIIHYYKDTGLYVFMKARVSDEFFEKWKETEEYQEYLNWLKDVGSTAMQRWLITNTMALDEDYKPTWVEKFSPDKIQRKVATWSKFIKILRRKAGLEWSDDDQQRFSEAAGQALRPPKYTLKIVKGSAISETYHEKHFGSCMYRSQQVEFYDYQDNVEMLRIEDEHGELAGRALIWHNVEDTRKENARVTLLDRVYPSDGGLHIEAAINYAKEQGWYWKAQQSIGAPVAPEDTKLRVRVQDVENYPYMDTFAFSNEPGNFDNISEISMSNRECSKRQWRWQCQDNICPWTDEFMSREPLVECIYSGNMIPESEALYLSYYGEFIGMAYEEYTTHTVDGQQILDRDAMEVDNYRDPVHEGHLDIVESIDGAMYYIGPSFATALFQVEQITAGEFEGYYAPTDQVIEIAGQTWHEDDEDLPDEEERERLEEEYQSTKSKQTQTLFSGDNVFQPPPITGDMFREQLRQHITPYGGFDVRRDVVYQRGVITCIMGTTTDGRYIHVDIFDNELENFLEGMRNPENWINKILNIGQRSVEDILRSESPTFSSWNPIITFNF